MDNDMKWWAIAIVGAIAAMALISIMADVKKQNIETARYQAIEACFKAGQTDCGEKVK